MSEELAIGTRVDHDLYGEGLISRVSVSKYEIFFHKAGKMDVSKDSDELEVIDKVENTSSGSGGGTGFAEMQEMLTHILDKYGAIQFPVELGDKWHGGKMILVPGKQGLQSKEIPIETFFHKMVMMRDKIRVLEQSVNSSNLSDEEKVNIQQYISRVYGSMTSFNVLFDDKNDFFSSK